MAESVTLLRAVEDDEKAMLLGRLINGSWEYGECWVWEGATNGVGYGLISFRNQRWYVHRLAYSVWRGPIPAGLVIDHLCGTTWCWRPTHLEAVTTRTNIRRALTEQRTHCKHGHEFNEANTYINTVTGHRLCRTCRATRERARRQRLYAIGRGA